MSSMIATAQMQTLTPHATYCRFVTALNYGLVAFFFFYSVSGFLDRADSPWPGRGSNWRLPLGLWGPLHQP